MIYKAGNKKNLRDDPRKNGEFQGVNRYHKEEECARSRILLPRCALNGLCAHFYYFIFLCFDFLMGFMDARFGDVGFGMSVCGDQILL